MDRVELLELLLAVARSGWIAPPFKGSQAPKTFSKALQGFLFALMGLIGPLWAFLRPLRALVQPLKAHKGLIKALAVPTGYSQGLKMHWLWLQTPCGPSTDTSKALDSLIAPCNSPVRL